MNTPKHTPGPQSPNVITLLKQAMDAMEFAADSLNSHDNASADLAAAILAVGSYMLTPAAHAAASAPALVGALRGLIEQAGAQFKVGDRHATFNKQTIDAARATLRSAGIED